MRRGDRIEGHEEMVNNHRDTVGGQEDHHHDLKAPGIPQVGEEPVHRLVVSLGVVRGGGRRGGGR